MRVGGLLQNKRLIVRLIVTTSLLCSLECNARTFYLDCRLVSTTTSTDSYAVRSIESDNVLLEVRDDPDLLAISTQSPAIPISLKVNTNQKEWRTSDGAGIDSNTSTTNKFSVQRVYEDQLGQTRTTFDLDRVTGELTQEVISEIGEGFSVVNITHGICRAAKERRDTQF